MATELRYVATVKDGQIIIHGRKGFDADMLAFNDERILIKVSKYRKDKSMSQRGYYRGVIVPEILEGLVDMGWKRFQLSLEIVHDMLREKFLTVEIPNEDGEALKITRSTEDLNMGEYAEYITECIEWSATFLNISISEPQKQGILNFKQQ